MAIEIKFDAKAFSACIIYFRQLYPDYPEDQGDELDRAIVTQIRAEFPKTTARIFSMPYYHSIDKHRQDISGYPHVLSIKLEATEISLFYKCNKRDLMFVQRTLSEFSEVKISTSAERKLLGTLTDLKAYKRS